MQKTILLLVMLLLLCGCTKNQQELAAVKKMLNEVEQNDNFLQLSVGEALNYFTFDESDIDEALIYISLDGAVADEVVVVRAKDKAAAGRVYDALADRIDEKKNSFRGYVPSEYDKICRTSVKKSDLYVYYAVSDKNNEYEAVFSTAFA